MTDKRACQECGAPVRPRKLKCAACTRENSGWAKAMWLQGHPENVRRSRRKWKEANPEKFAAAEKRWRSSPAGKASARKHKIAWLARNRPKQNAWALAYYYRKQGRLAVEIRLAA